MGLEAVEIISDGGGGVGDDGAVGSTVVAGLPRIQHVGLDGLDRTAFREGEPALVGRVLDGRDVGFGIRDGDAAVVIELTVGVVDVSLPDFFPGWKRAIAGVVPLCGGFGGHSKTSRMVNLTTRRWPAPNASSWSTS